MPKKRIKRSGNISKSGTLTQNFRKELKVDSHLNNFILRDVFHSQNKKNLDKVVFDDTKTIVFNSKVVDTTLGIEKSYIEGDYVENNKLVNTPNLLDHDSTYEVTKIVRPEDYSHVLYSNYKNGLDNNRYNPFVEDFIDYENIFSKNPDDLVDQTTSFEEIGYNFKKNVYEIKRNFEEIDISFNKGLINLSFNLNNTVAEYTNPTSNSFKDLPYVSFPKYNKSYSNYIHPDEEWPFLALNSNTFYLDKNTANNKDNFYFLHDPKQNYFQSVDNFSNYSPITNNPFTKYPNDVIGANLDSSNSNYPSDNKRMSSVRSLSNPITDFGFPFDKKYRGNDEVTVSLSDYISEDFILEKVHVEFDVKNYAISTEEFTPCMNFLNFFILNQRKFADTNNLTYSNSYDNDIKLQKRYNGSISNVNYLKYFDNVSGLGSYKLTRVSSPLASEDLKLGWGGNSHQLYPSTYHWIDNTHTYETYSSSFSEHCHRELITNIKIANVGNIINEEVASANKNYFYSLDGADAIITSDLPNSKLNSWNSQTVYDNILTDWKTVSITSKIKSYSRNSKLKSFSEFEIYPKRSNKRSGVDIQSERSIESEFEVSNVVGAQDHRSQRFDLGYSSNINYDNNPYIVKPTDELIFGFNFAPSMLLSDEDPVTNTNNRYANLTGRDVISLDLSKLKIKLFGRYVREHKAFVPKKSEFENKNIKKINELCTNVVDKVGLPSPYLLKGAYYNSYIGGSAYPNAVSSDFRRFGYFLNIPIDTTIEFPDGWHNKYDENGNLKVHPPLNPDMWRFSPTDTISDSVRTDFRITDKYFYRLENGNKIGFDKYLYYRYNVDHFGFISDKVNYNKHYAYTENETGKTTFNTTKYFRLKGYYLQKDPAANPPGDATGEEHKINSYNKDIHSRVTDSLFKEA